MGPALPLGVRLRLDGVLYWSCLQPARTEMAKRVCRWLLSPVISVPRPAKLGFPTNLVCSYHTPTVWGQGSSLQHFVFILTSQFHVLIIRSVTEYCLYTSWYHLVALTRFCKFPFSFHKASVPPGSIIDFKPTSLCPRLVKILLIACITTIFFFLFIYFFIVIIIALCVDVKIKVVQSFPWACVPSSQTVAISAPEGFWDEAMPANFITASIPTKLEGKVRLHPECYSSW